MPYKDPEKQRAYQREYQRLHRAGSNKTPRKTLNPDPVRVKTAKDILDLLSEVIDAVKAEDADTFVRARTIGYLAGIALKAVETADLEERLLKLEEYVEENKGRRR